MSKTFKAIAGGALALFATSCEQGQETAASQIYVLVDLSRTWHRPEQKERNGKVLAEVGHGVADAARNLESPLGVQYRIVGADSLERPPVCDVLYVPRLAPTKAKAEYEVNSRSQLKNYLSDSCPREIEARPAEPLTEIRTAIASVANQPAAGASRREIVLISDFLEETRAPVDLNADLSGFHAILLYRPVAQDLNDPTILNFRVKAWQAELEARGARVDIIPDTGIRRATIASFLTQGL